MVSPGNCTKDFWKCETSCFAFGYIDNMMNAHCFYKLAFFIFLCMSEGLVGQSVTLDESDADWPSNAPLFADRIGDGNAAGIDFRSCRLMNDENYLFLHIDLSAEINLQENNYLALWLDIDDNAATGLQKYGIGADIVYFPGERYGRHYVAGTSSTVFHDELGWVSSPTVTSSVFEISLLRTIVYNGKTIRLGDNIRLVFSDESVAGDQMPDAGNVLRYTFTNVYSFRPAPFQLSKPSPDLVRILSYNVLRDNLFNTATQASARRVFQAIRPDIIGFCEIYNNTSAQTAGLMESYLPSTPGQTWYHAGVNPDIRVVSRYPVINTYSLDGNGAFLLDLGKTKLVLIVMHLPCCANDVQRQQEVDKIMAFVRALRFGISPFQVAQNTPVVLLGDTNLVGKRRQQYTLISGDIADNSGFGVDFDPDWDESTLEDALVPTTNLPFTFTWYNKQGSYSAGRLDYILFTGSVMYLKNSYALWTEALTSAQLAENGLEKGDVARISDHLPVVGDFTLPILSAVQNSTDAGNFIRWQAEFLEISPNEDSYVLISDIVGRKLFELRLQGQSTLSIPLADLSGNNVLVVSVVNTKTGQRQGKLISLP